MVLQSLSFAQVAHTNEKRADPLSCCRLAGTFMCGSHTAYHGICLRLPWEWGSPYKQARWYLLLLRPARG